MLTYWVEGEVMGLSLIRRMSNFVIEKIYACHHLETHFNNCTKQLRNVAHRCWLLAL